MMTLVAAAMATTMSAQLYVGGELGLSFGQTKVTEPGLVTATGKTKTTTVKILPEIGYNLNEKMAVGVAFGYDFNKNVTPLASYDVTSKTNEFVFKPYFRYYFVKWDKVGLFADAQFGMGFGKNTYETYEDEGIFYYPVSTTSKTTSFSFAIVPGIAFTPCEKVSVVAKLGDGLGYWYKQTKTPYSYYGDKKTTSNKFGLDLETLGLTVGVYFTL